MTTTDDHVAALGADVSDHQLVRPDGRVVAWTESGVAGGRPILRVPGTPASRFSLRADRTPWFERGLRVINTERPGFGASTRLLGRGFGEPADDLVAILDHLEIDDVPVYGGSGASPHILALAARHPDRVRAATILVGSAPMDAEEAARQIDLNALEYELYHAGKLDEIWRLCVETRDALMADPLAGFRDLMASSTDADRAIVEDPAWQQGFVVGIMEALRSGVGGWYDESIAGQAPWDIDLAAVTADVTWWHSDGDRNCPLSAAERLIRSLANARLRVWTDAGHLTPYHHEPEILDELLARC
jgi:pimeloyl-ACP methyl ester carboxylesterase